MIPWQSLQENVIHSSYIQIIFVGPETDEYKLIFVGLGQPLMNIWDIRFDFDRTHIFISGATSPRNIRGLYSSVMWHHRRI
jgi:hypothetical protein